MHFCLPLRWILGCRPLFGVPDLQSTGQDSFQFPVVRGEFLCYSFTVQVWRTAEEPQPSTHSQAPPVILRFLGILIISPRWIESVFSKTEVLCENLFGKKKKATEEEHRFSKKEKDKWLKRIQYVVLMNQFIFKHSLTSMRSLVT